MGSCEKRISILLNKILRNWVLVLMEATTEQKFETKIEKECRLEIDMFLTFSWKEFFSLFEYDVTRFIILPLVVAYSETWRTPSFCKCSYKILLSEFKGNVLQCIFDCYPCFWVCVCFISWNTLSLANILMHR